MVIMILSYELSISLHVQTQRTWLAVMDFTWLVVLIWILAWLAVKIQLFINWMQLHSCELDAWYKLVLSVQQFWTFWSHSVNLCEYSTILLFMSIVQNRAQHKLFTCKRVQLTQSLVEFPQEKIEVEEPLEISEGPCHEKLSSKSFYLCPVIRKTEGTITGDQRSWKFWVSNGFMHFSNRGVEALGNPPNQDFGNNIYFILYIFIRILPFLPPSHPQLKILYGTLNIISLY